MATRSRARATSACPPTSAATWSSGRPWGTTSPLPLGLASRRSSQRSSRPRTRGSRWRSRASGRRAAPGHRRGT
eukprot:12009008-Alexandrium_andersonii.AAC.1